jgi:hypothetical protein
MTSHGFGRYARVGGWLAERATDRGVPVSVGLLCATAVAKLGMSGAALTVDNSPGWPEPRCVTDTCSARLAELHVTVGEGPCVDAWQRGGPALVADLAAATDQRRWPLFAPLAVEAGARALFAFPMCVGAIRVGVLALYRVSAGHLEPTALSDGLAFAELAMRLLLDEQAGLPTTDGIAAVPDGPPLLTYQVHQATGVIAAQLGVGMAEGFARLRAHAFAAQRPLDEVAGDVVARRLRFRPEGHGR